MKKYFQVLEISTKTRTLILLSAVLLLFLCSLVAFALYLCQESEEYFLLFIVC